MLLNENLANFKNVATPHGPINFNEKGECRDLTPEQEAEYKKVIGFKVVEEKVEEPKKPVAKKPAKEDK
jgi:hypothetical protein